jgi:RNA-directed DNA polymerase
MGGLLSYYRDINQGISRGCPLSPILGAIYLKALDDHFEDKQLCYVRYMEDILILTKTRWHNRKAVKKLNQTRPLAAMGCHRVTGY